MAGLCLDSNARVFFFYFYTCYLKALFCRHFVNEEAIVRGVKLIAESLAVRLISPQEEYIKFRTLKERLGM